jgi:phenylalanyl-tRNA synthetase alpha subunit
LAPEFLDKQVAAAILAIANAGDLDELKAVRLEHAGDRSPLALANREIGALPPAAKAEAGKRMGQARGAINQAIDAKTAELEAVLAKTEQAMWLEELDVLSADYEKYREERIRSMLGEKAEKKKTVKKTVKSAEKKALVMLVEE